MRRSFLGCVGALLGVLWEHFLDPAEFFGGVFSRSWVRLLELPGGTLGSSGGPVGVLGWSWGLLAASYSPLVAPGSISGIFREIPGGHLVPFWCHFGYIFRSKMGMKI